MHSHSESYKQAGVDITAGYEAVSRMKAHVERTFTPGVVGGLGGFGGLFAPDLTGIKEPVLVSGTDGVGTKLKLAFLMDKHDTIGIDAVAMCVNDIICAGAAPMFFLDYIACGKNYPARIEAIVKGVSEGCIQAGCALVGGETAEMPGFYGEDEYDLAGFSVGLVDREKMLDKANVCIGDIVIALPSSGVHSNGFSLLRHAFGLNDAPENVNNHIDELGMTLGEALLTPTRIFVKPVLELLKNVEVHGLSNITGGGFYENIPRCIPETMSARVDRAKVRTLPVFDVVRKAGNISEHDMFNTFNMGVGMVAVAPETAAEDALRVLAPIGAYAIGDIVPGDGGLLL